jgi:hypothetical protein
MSDVVQLLNALKSEKPKKKDPVIPNPQAQPERLATDPKAEIKEN